MHIAELLAFAVGMQMVVANIKICPNSSWTYHSRACYLVPDAPLMTWHEGQKLCQDLGGDLVLPIDKDENDVVYQTLNGVQSVWLRCLFKGGTWDCIGYKQWSVRLKTNGDCAIMVLRDAGRWRGISCNAMKRLMCQAPARPLARSLTCSATPYGRPRCLTDHVLATFRFRSNVRCGIACTRDPTCRSFNLRGGMCQLNNVTASQVGGEFFKVVPSCAYYEFD